MREWGKGGLTLRNETNLEPHMIFCGEEEALEMTVLIILTSPGLNIMSGTGYVCESDMKAFI